MTSKNLLLTMFLLGALRPTNAQAEVPATAEARACCGLSAEEANLPLKSDAVESVSPIYRNNKSGRRLLGVRITYRTGVVQSPEALQYGLECLLARGKAQLSSGSPLAVSHVRATIRTDDGRISAEITSDYESSAAEIVQRTRRWMNVANK